MYNTISFIENVVKFIRIQLKLFYWKLKYGKRLKVGKNFRFRKGLIINISKEGLLEIGDNCFFNNYCSINCQKHIIIGNNNIFGENIKIYDHNHIFNDRSKDMRNSFNCSTIKIGANNWFGSNVVILSKAQINDHNVIGACIILNEKIQSHRLVKSDSKKSIETIIYK